MKQILNKILGMKLRNRMLLLYIVGGALPIILIGLYLIGGTNRILIQQAKSTEITEMEMVRKQTEELLKTVNIVSKYFIFDSSLEKIAAKEYENYQELVDDYKEYTAFVDYAKYYDNIISWISIYLDNETIKGNFHFVKVDETIENQEWYQNALVKGGGVFWQYIPEITKKYDSLSLIRLIKSIKGKNVGVLVLHVRTERMEEIIKDRDYDTMIILNGTCVIAKKERNRIRYDQISKFLPERDNGIHQNIVAIDNEEYVMTCVNMMLEESNDYIQLVSFRSHRGIVSNTNQQNRTSVYFFLFSIVISMMMILFFSLSFSNRIEHFRRQMKKAADGNFELAEKLGGNDEISELYDYLGTMIWEIQKLISEIYQEKLHAERLKGEQKDAEFKMLASQINPHFLYNTLETIRMKSRMNQQYEIEELVKMLAKILRKNIQAGSQDVTIRSEAELIDCYLKIQQYRFGERIQYRISVDPELEQYKILPLIMQPVVENAIVHGLESKEGIGYMDISIAALDDRIVITIQDDGAGMSDEVLKRLQRDMDKKNRDGTHIGIGNVHQRIRLRYGTDYGIHISSSLGIGTKVEIMLPKEESIRIGGISDV